MQSGLRLLFGPEMTEITDHVVTLAAAYLTRNPMTHDLIPSVLITIRDGLNALTGAAPIAEPPAELKPAVSIKKSVTPDYLVCLEDGKQLKMLKRHLRAAYDLTPDQYRAKWGLPGDYPMVAPNYAAIRSEFAKSIGLGKKRAPAPVAAPAAKRRRAA